VHLVRTGRPEAVVEVSAIKSTDTILWGALGCALVGTAHSEWSLAVSVGAHPWIAAAVPGALDLYVIRALQVRRDVFLSVLAMVAANVAWYLVHSGDLPVDWPLRSAVGAVAPLVVWRVHALKYTRTRQELLWGLEAGAESAPEPERTRSRSRWPWRKTSAPAPGEEPHPVEDECAPAHEPWCGLTHPDDEPCSEYGYPPAPEPAPVWSPGYHLDGCDGVHPLEGPAECILRARELTGAVAPDYVPAWLESGDLASADEYADKWECPDAPVPHLRAVPALAPEDEMDHTLHSKECPDGCACPSALAYVPQAALMTGDLEYLPTAQEYIATADRPTVRGLRRYANVGQARAERLLAHLGVRKEKS